MTHDELLEAAIERLSEAFGIEKVQKERVKESSDEQLKAIADSSADDLRSLASTDGWYPFDDDALYPNKPQC